MIHDPRASLDPQPHDWPVLVTGAAGFVGGHIARHIAQAGHYVRGLVRGQPPACPDDPKIEWISGDVRDPVIRRRAVAGVRAVIHAAGWVSLGRDAGGLSQAVNVEATRGLLDDAKRARVERFVLTSTLHTLAAGTSTNPADETSPWNLECVDSPYARSKREAESLVRQASQGTFTTVALCPGMVLGPRDPKPTSTRLLHVLARSRVAFLPRGGIPIVDARVLARAHRMALTAGRPGERYAVAGPYLSYAELAGLVAEITGRPRFIVPLPDMLERPLKAVASLLERLGPGTELSGTTVAGGFLRLHVSGNRADVCFGLVHPPPLESIRSSLGVKGQD
ncbi:MAG: NAD-dependent epimerase/dehydratase family protein [Isosphaeraceae bacterium]